MELKHITEDVCADCGAITIAESRNSRSHCNGTTGEERTFACGRSVCYSPNFKRVEVSKECPNKNSEKIKKKRREILKSSIVDMIETSRVDEKYKEELTRSIKYV